MKFTINEFHKKYPTDDACLDALFVSRYGDIKKCPQCKKETTFNRIKSRKCYCCQFCGFQLHPVANTIFHKSDTPLTSWFYALYLFSTSKNGVSAKELERQLGCTYKTAWRIAKQIRLLFEQNKEVLTKITEIDESYFGGKGGNNKRGRGSENKTPVFGMVERKGIVKAKVTVDTKRKTVMPIIREHVKLGTEVMTDEYLPYRSLAKEGYVHQTIAHGAKEYVRGNVHVNTLEGFWSQLKRSINGTYHAVSPKYLQLYVDEFSYRYNHRSSFEPIFSLLLARVVQLI
ncbi:TPA: IS1595 family transposase [Patescibacteria group bacterium]|uniref:ISSpo3, transposase n=1 Tax=Candidatus Gottesmanbacteria bacterium GW2011_GWA1_43_11 TaxID=1618436 RepID=A0A0G1EKW1_9BACT|nr:MAG: ISSpo3, transposase [Candidatus Gottesmanbacteria bacterium GW2011_GWA1_43_11]HCS79335.1 IS1595 family transposase [Patescibacteria group bacterium]